MANPPDNDCLFCKIVAGEIACTKVHETDSTLAFEDIHPTAPVHVVLVPKRHVAQIDDCDSSDASMLSDLMLAVAEVARFKGVTESGYRVTINNGKQGGQEVMHLHAHVLGGRQMGSKG